MRFIGNKDLIVNDILELLENTGLLNRQLNFLKGTKKDLVFFDAFCGTGAVSDVLKSYMDIIINDMIDWSVIYTQGRLMGTICSFETLGFDPFDFINSNEKILQGFFYNNYSPGNSNRMYFTTKNAGRIDYIRFQIEEWKNQSKITNNEYAYLLASLIESISYISNTAGVYGAFLKHWDPRAKKELIFKGVSSNSSKVKSLKAFNAKIEDIIENVECDILYLDPPYTQNQYGTQYHILQTLVLNDNPTISKITGSRPTGPMRSDWSKDIKSHILLDKILAKTKAKFVVFSYSKDGFMSKSFIEASLKRYGKSETYICKKISYSKYKNFKSRGDKEHFEYLFFIELKDKSDFSYESPLNYIGSKSNMINELKHHFPASTKHFIDAFGGGFNVGINSTSDKIIYNDLNFIVKDLVQSFKVYDTYKYILYLKNIIKKFELEAKDKESYLKIREYYNSHPKGERDPKLLYAVILYGFNQQIRFNNDLEFNNPVGMRWFNDKILEKFISFSRVMKEKNITFKSKDYSELTQYVQKDSFFYFDPPYRLTTGSYNDGKRGFNGWDFDEENRLLDFIDYIDDKDIPFMLSYVVNHKGKTNRNLIKWVDIRGYDLIEFEEIKGVPREEIVITNYDIDGKTKIRNKKQVSKGWLIPRPFDTEYPD